MRVVFPFAVVGFAFIVWQLWSRSFEHSSAVDLLKQAERARFAGDYPRAEELAASALQKDPALGGASLMAARCSALQQDFPHAVEYLEEMRSTDPAELLQAALWRADWNYHELAHLSAAEEAYRDALKLDPDHLDANQGLVELLGLCGRSREAIPSIVRIVRQDPNTDLLILLLRDEGGIANVGLLQTAHRNAPDDPLPLMGLAWKSAADGDNSQALEFLESAVALAPEHAAVQLALGRQLLVLSRYQQLLQWYRNLKNSPVEYAEFWILSGELSEHFGQADSAIRCYWEASRIAPELDRPCVRLISLLEEAGRTETARRFAERLQDLLRVDSAQSRILMKARAADSDDMLNLVTAYQAAGRIWEAHAWSRLAMELEPSNDAVRRLHAELSRELGTLSPALTVESANVARQVDLSEYPLPDFKSITVPASSTESESVIAGDYSFQEEASAAGLEFRFFNGTDGELTRRMYEFTGGGIGVIDYDADGWPDLCFSQGCSWPPGNRTETRCDQLFRNVAGRGFQNVTALAGIDEHDFGQGVAVGDIDSDGFPDLLIANIGHNRLWRNNGDGTFWDVTGTAGITGDEWSTSCLMADLDADGDTDLYITNYLSGDDLFERICQHPEGGTVACLPTHFAGAVDRLWLNQGDLTFSIGNESVLSTPPDGKGLGVAAWDADHSGRLSLLVANDTTPNLFFMPERLDDGAILLSERGILSGIAVNSDGKPEGCMGIAVGDVDRNGYQDIQITNFLAESNTLYLGFPGPLFEDRTGDYNLHQPTLNRLGFGTQFVDLNLDGQLELFVTNGHVDDLRRYGRPYRMPPQVFRLSAGRFVAVPADVLAPYFQQEWLGRASASIDWNGDGRDDLVVGHLDADYALLTNRSNPAGHSLTLRLIGSLSNRDAAGTRVSIQAGNELQHAQVLAGGSYHASSQRLLTFGLGEASQVTRLVVEWPSGQKQEFLDLPAPGRYVLVEGGTLLTDSPR